LEKHKERGIDYYVFHSLKLTSTIIGLTLSQSLFIFAGVTSFNLRATLIYEEHFNTLTNYTASLKTPLPPEVNTPCSPGKAAG
jgi:hypothetical protein